MKSFIKKKDMSSPEKKKFDFKFVKPLQGSSKKKRIRARGDSTHGKGNKGQRQRSKVRAGFEGGQTPYYLRMKKNVRLRPPGNLKRYSKSHFKTYSRKVYSGSSSLSRPKKNFLGRRLIVSNTDSILALIKRGVKTIDSAVFCRVKNVSSMFMPSWLKILKGREKIAGNWEGVIVRAFSVSKQAKQELMEAGILVETESEVVKKKRKARK